VKITLNKDVVKFVRPDSPREVRVMAAKGAIPINPDELVKVLYVLCHDKDHEIRKIAQETLANFAPKLINVLMDGNLDGFVIDYIVRYHAHRKNFFTKAVLNSNTLDETFQYLASKNDGDILERISLNHERILRSKAIAATLLRNPAFLGNPRDKIIEFLQRNEGIDAADDEMNKPSLHDNATNADLTQQVPQKDTSTGSGEKEVNGNSQTEEATEEEELRLSQRIQKMTVAEKIKLAQFCDKESRSILLKDSSRMVVSAVVKSPKITEGEVLSLAQAKQSDDEVIRLITINKEWMKNYQIRLALACNPKTPVGVALRLLPTLNRKDLKDISGSRNISTSVSSTAKKIVIQKDKKA